MNNPTKTLREGAIWALAGRWAERILSLVSITILARLLTREQFGLVATAGLVVGAVEVFFSFGFDWALIRLPKPSTKHYSTAWTLRLLVGFACAGALSILAIPASNYFKNGDLVWIILTMALTTIIGSAENPALVDFRRRFDFRPELVLRLLVKLTALLVSVWMAWKYRTYWALPVSVLISRCVGVVASYRMHEFRPTWTLSERKELLGFSVWLLVNNLIEYAKSRTSDIFVARQLGSTALGTISLAQELSQIAVSEIAAPINRAVFSQFSLDRENVGKLREGYLLASGMIWTICLPVALLLLLNSSLVVRVLYGSQWLEAARPLSILLVANIFLVVTSNAGYVFLALGETRFLAKLSMLGVLATVAALLILVPLYKIDGAAASYAIGVLAPLPFLMIILFARLHMRPMDFVRNKWRSLVSAMSLIIAARFLPGDSGSSTADAVLELCRNSISCAFAYVATLAVLWIVSGRPKGTESIMLEHLSRLHPFGKRSVAK